MMKPEKRYEQAKCAWCEGSGKRKIAPGNIASCVVCGGKGNLSLLQPSSFCRHCEGTGRRNTSNRCMICAGTGWEHSALAES
jgi:DnaJ-class molecular chaperone